MSVGDACQAAESGFVRTAAAKEAVTKETVICPRCGSDRSRRVERKKFLEKNIYPIFGYFPWRCGRCRAKFFLKKRKRNRDPKSQDYVS